MNFLKDRTSRRLAHAVAIATLTLIGGCGGGSSGGETPPPVSPLPQPEPKPQPVQAPAISSEPAGRTVAEGQSATFTVSASGSAPLTYQWSRNGVDVVGATSASHNIAAATFADNGSVYRVSVNNAAGTVGSAGVPLLVDSAGIMPFLGGPGAKPAQSNLWPTSANAVYAIGQEATLAAPTVSVDSAGNLIVADPAGIRKVTPAGVVTTLALADGGPGSAGKPVPDGITKLTAVPRGLAVSADGTMYVLASDATTSGSPLGVYVLRNGAWTLSTVREQQMRLMPMAIAADAAGNGYVASVDVIDNGYVCAVGPCYGMYSAVTVRRIAVDGKVDVLFTARMPGLYPSRPDTPFNEVGGIAVGQDKSIYLSDRRNHTIVRISAQGTFSVLAGAPGEQGSADGTGAGARFSQPHQLTVDASGNVYVIDAGNSTIRKITPAGVVTTVAGTPQRSELAYSKLPGVLPKLYGIAAAGNALYATTDNGMLKIRLP